MPTKSARSSRPANVSQNGPPGTERCDRVEHADEIRRDVGTPLLAARMVRRVFLPKAPRQLLALLLQLAAARVSRPVLEHGERRLLGDLARVGAEAREGAGRRLRRNAA